jgi:hypothetical protein
MFGGRGRALVGATILTMLAVCIWAASASAYVYWTNTAPGFEGVANGTTIGRATNSGHSVNVSFIHGLPEGGLSGIAVDAHHIYFTDADHIGEADLKGKHVKLHAFSNALTTSGGGLAVAGKFIYWWTARGMGRADVNGTHVNNHFIRTRGGGDEIAVSGRYIFWDTVTASERGGGHIGRADINGSHAHNAFITVPDEPNGVAVYRGHVYWTNNFTGKVIDPLNGIWSGPPTIGRALFSGRSVDENWAQVNGGSALAVDSDGFYFSDAQLSGGTDLQTVAHLNINGGGLEPSFIPLTADPVTPPGVAVDERGP